MRRSDFYSIVKKEPPLAVKLLFMLPWLVALLALAYPPALMGLWQARPGIGVWLLYGLNMVATAGFIWFVQYWNLFWKG